MADLADSLIAGRIGSYLKHGDVAKYVALFAAVIRVLESIAKGDNKARLELFLYLLSKPLIGRFRTKADPTYTQLGIPRPPSHMDKCSIFVKLREITNSPRNNV